MKWYATYRKCQRRCYVHFCCQVQGRFGKLFWARVSAIHSLPGKGPKAVKSATARKLLKFVPMIPMINSKFLSTHKENTIPWVNFAGFGFSESSKALQCRVCRACQKTQRAALTHGKRNGLPPMPPGQNRSIQQLLSERIRKMLAP